MKIAVFFGGHSGEAVISAQSAKVILKHIDRDRYKVFEVEVKPDEWIATCDNRRVTLLKEDMSIVDGKEEIHIDFVLNMIHGTPGEDGLLQAYFEMLHIPHSTGDSVVMGLTFDKEFTQSVLRANGISVAKNIALHRYDQIHPEQIVTELGLPCFVKPTRSGSSLGITKVRNVEELLPAIAKARKEFENVLIESFLNGKEITCGVYRNGNSIVALPITEIIPANDFFDFESKYESSVTQEITPAKISDQIWEKCQNQSKFIYNLLNCKGLIRVDYMLVGETLYVIELNTVPGFSEKSLVPQQLAQAGINIRDFINQIIESNSPS